MWKLAVAFYWYELDYCLSRHRLSGLWIDILQLIFPSGVHYKCLRDHVQLVSYLLLCDCGLQFHVAWPLLWCTIVADWRDKQVRGARLPGHHPARKAILLRLKLVKVML